MSSIAHPATSCLGRIAQRLTTLLLVLCCCGGLLNAASPLYLVFPKVVQGTSELTGVAVANPTSDPAQTILYLVADDGTILDARELPIAPYSQLARNLTELFPSYFSSADEVDAWIFLESSNISVVGFFLSLTGTPGLRRIDGIDGAEAAVVGPAFSGSVLFPEILTGPGEYTTIQLVAFHDSPVPVQLELYGPAGGAPLSTRTVFIPPDGGRYSARVEELFGSGIPAKSFIKATATRGLVGYESFGNAQYTASRNAIPFTSTARDLVFSLFGPQLVEGFGMTSEVTLLNPTSSPASVKLTAYRMVAGKSVITAEKDLQLRSNTLLKESAGSLLDLPTDFVGWLRVDSSITGILGTISFGGLSGTYLSSVELQKSPVTDVVFSHVADGFGYFTGLTFVNISNDTANVQIEVYGITGTKTGSASFTLEPFEHRPQVLSQIIPDLDPQVGGFVLVKSDIGIFTFELFGYAPKGEVLALAAVPPQRGNGTFSGKLSVSGSNFALPSAASNVFPASRAKGIDLKIESAFFPGEIVVQFHPQTSSKQAMDVAQSLELDPLVSAPAGLFLMEAGKDSGAAPLDSGGPSDGLVLKQRTLALIEALNRRSEVLYAEPNYVVHADAAPDDPYLDLQWHYKTIKMEEAWDITTGSAGITVAVIDTGVRTDHPDLASRLSNDGYDFISDPQRALDGNGIDPNPHDPGTDPEKKTSSFHGTHVAGTIGAVTNNRGGVAGIDWNCRIMALRVLGANGRGGSFDIAQAIYYAAGLPNSSGRLPSRPARVINLSLGAPQPSQVEHEAVSAALAQNTIVVASAGNNSSDEPNYPAEFPGVIKVGAIDLAGQLARYSNYGARIDVVAPGGDVMQDLNGDTYSDGVLSLSWNEANNEPNFRFLNGTSMASPHVAGIVSLMLSIQPGLTPAQVVNILRTTALDLGDPGRDDQFGYGLVDPVAALKAVGGQGAQAPKLVISTEQLNFGLETTRMTVTLSNGGGGTLWIDPITYDTTDDGGWLIPQFSGSTTLLVEVNRQGLPDGDYRGTIGITSNGGNTQIVVLMKVGTPEEVDIGTVFVFSVDPRTIDVLTQATTTTSNDLVYEMPPTPTGEYVVIAGTDSNQDGYICDIDDYCGFFPLFSDPELLRIEASKDRNPVNFSIGLLTSGSQSVASSERRHSFKIQRETVDLEWLSTLFSRKRGQ
ncbi:MAG: S8 family peptidase [Acidobacteriota bacterium]|nr:MAG: S8 family peptidase [Acidobacteriota bacterium]